MRRSFSANLMITASLTLILAVLLVYGLWAIFVRLEPEMLQRSELSGMAARILRDLKFDSEGKPISSKVYGTMGQVLEALPFDCRRRLNFDPPCRLNFDPGMEAGIVDAGCA